MIYYLIHCTVATCLLTPKVAADPAAVEEVANCEGDENIPGLLLRGDVVFIPKAGVEDATPNVVAAGCWVNPKELLGAIDP